jgi:hypothetical protein
MFFKGIRKWTVFLLNGFGCWSFFGLLDLLVFTLDHWCLLVFHRLGRTKKRVLPIPSKLLIIKELLIANQ